MRLLVVSVLLVFGFPFIMTDVVDSFSSCNRFFFNEQPPVIPGILVNSKLDQNQNQYRIICQKVYSNNYRFATLYDTGNKIPVFSAYKYTGHTGKRPDVKWEIEPQPNGISFNQAALESYKNSKNVNVNRGHLFPCCHAADEEAAKSTFTLTNVVPQYIRFNDGSWKRMEQKVKSIMDSDCRDKNNPGNILAYVLTGAVPSQHKLNNEVNIPSDMWTVFCCYNSQRGKWVSQAHLAANKDESKEERKTISAKTLVELQNILKNKYNKEITLFHGDCSEILNPDVSQPPETNCCEEDKE